MAITARVWTAGKLLLLVGALAATFVIFAVLAARVAVRARDVSVPDLMGRSVNEATSLTSELELQMTVDETRRPDAKVPAGHVIGQEPPPGSSSRRQRSVRVWLSSGPRIARAPALVGESQRAAEIRIVQDGLQPGPVAEIRSALYPPDVVVAQDPSPGVQTTDVRLLVNRGEDRASYVMPDLIGVEGARAADILRGQGFRVSITAQSVATGLPPGIVTRQSPAGGYQVHPGDAITIEVSR
jgi:eukaryotic-like serine/threonine-protein kinase